MLLRDELLEKKEIIRRASYFQNERLAAQSMMIANEIYEKGIEGLQKATSQGKISYDITLIHGREANEEEIQWTKSHYDAVPLISHISINNGIDFVYPSGSMDFENCKYWFSIKEYKKII